MKMERESGALLPRMRAARRWSGLALLMIFFVTACAGPAPAATGTGRIDQVTASRVDVPRYEMLELTVALTADYQNPFDAREVSLDAVFTGPDGKDWAVPGFWDAKDSWRVRFTPSLDGKWRYQLRVTDKSGAGQPAKGEFTVTPSDKHGWLQVASWVNPAESQRYLAFKDGTPFYGVGHCDAFTLLSQGLDANGGIKLFSTMAQAGENMVVYWPVYSNPFFNTSFDSYSAPDLSLIDLVLRDAEAKGIFLVFTVWDHPQLRGKEHPWGPGQWDANNGFRKLGTVQEFFNGSQQWAWQENLYRYMIARWGYSPAIGLWQTISEIEGTNAGDLRDAWHKKVNDYFAAHDPYRHPTTASMGGDQWWPEGYAVTDMPQMHSYVSGKDPVGTGKVIADWTVKMGQAAAKPNFIGEFGSSDERSYPELAHNAYWAALTGGAAVTPMEWNDSSQWSTMSEAMLADIGRVASFVKDLPLARANPLPVSVRLAARDAKLMGQAIAAKDLAVAWVQDVSSAGAPIDAVRASVTEIENVSVTIPGLGEGQVRVRIYDPWQGVYLSDAVQTVTADGLVVALPAFTRDLVVRVER